MNIITRISLFLVIMITLAGAVSAQGLRAQDFAMNDVPGMPGKLMSDSPLVPLNPPGLQSGFRGRMILPTLEAGKTASMSILPVEFDSYGWVPTGDRVLIEACQKPSEQNFLGITPASCIDPVTGE
jgi:hypothetical protein